MKKAKMTKPQTGPVLTVEDYIDRAPEASLAALIKLRTAIRSALPKDVTETISYGIPAFKRKRVLLWFAAFAKHTSLFPTAAVIDMFQDELAEYKPSKGTIHFPLDRPLPVALIKKIVKARVAEDEKRP